MCESHAYLMRDGKAELYMENVNLAGGRGRGLRLTDLLGRSQI